MYYKIILFLTIFTCGFFFLGNAQDPLLQNLPTHSGMATQNILNSTISQTF
jgi:hypothetical protein